ncbi:hypothetical protein BJ986_000935 [Phycicoccus badiiscoriae]|uniref:GPI inositol-deacylase PGAP1-like alpha/beta domain-containing protein n=1 Tax=Pedococcus badiiscoriae TaxID=642776 RepID=A0A852WBL1_9MICO|nr:hypothetical protein [Pedococcus badiiscoriae]
MNGKPIRVRGGSSGTAVGLDSLDAAAGLLADVAHEAAVVVSHVAAVATDPDLVAGSVLSPLTGAWADAALIEAVGPLGLPGEMAALLSLSVALAAASRSYRQAEEAAARTLELAQDTVMYAVGACAPAIVVGVLALDALGVEVARLLDEAVFATPAIADVAGGAEGLVAGLRSDPLTRPFIATPPRTEGLTAGQDYEVAVRALADGAALWGLLSDRGRARVTPQASPRAGARVPRSLEDLAADQRNVGDSEAYAGHVRVIEVPRAQGSAWIVEISGTQVWDPGAGRNPFDLTTDVRTMAQDGTVLAEGVQQALEQAQASSARALSAQASAAQPSTVPTPGPVMLVGHSLGGMAAAGLASSPRFTQAQPVTHVVTMGSPVGRMPIPADIQVLSLEHRQDAVPRLDGVPNPDRATWVTVSRELGGGEDPTDPAGLDRASEAHDTRLYVRTAALVDQSTDPGLAAWRSGASDFFAGDTHGPPVVRDYTVERIT